MMIIQQVLNYQRARGLARHRYVTSAGDIRGDSGVSGSVGRPVDFMLQHSSHFFRKSDRHRHPHIVHILVDTNKQTSQVYISMIYIHMHSWHPWMTMGFPQVSPLTKASPVQRLRTEVRDRQTAMLGAPQRGQFACAARCASAQLRCRWRGSSGHVTASHERVGKSMTLAGDITLMAGA